MGFHWYFVILKLGKTFNQKIILHCFSDVKVACHDEICVSKLFSFKNMLNIASNIHFFPPTILAESHYKPFFTRKLIFIEFSVIFGKCREGNDRCFICKRPLLTEKSTPTLGRR
jgi:hypothetical protein